MSKTTINGLEQIYSSHVVVQDKSIVELLITEDNDYLTLRFIIGITDKPEQGNVKAISQNEVEFTMNFLQSSDVNAVVPGVIAMHIGELAGRQLSMSLIVTRTLHVEAGRTAFVLQYAFYPSQKNG